jgi:hypothetical protein
LRDVISKVAVSRSDERDGLDAHPAFIFWRRITKTSRSSSNLRKLELPKKMAGENKMSFTAPIASRSIVLALVCALICQGSPIAEAKQLSPEIVHSRILKRGIGNWVGVELQNGTAFAGRIVEIDQQSFGMQLHNDPSITPVRYSDVLNLHTGVARGALLGVIAGGVGAVVAMAVLMHHETPPTPAFPTQPSLPLFP